MRAMSMKVKTEARGRFSRKMATITTVWWMHLAILVERGSTATSVRKASKLAQFNRHLSRSWRCSRWKWNSLRGPSRRWKTKLSKQRQSFAKRHSRETTLKKRLSLRSRKSRKSRIYSLRCTRSWPKMMTRVIWGHSNIKILTSLPRVTIQGFCSMFWCKDHRLCGYESCYFSWRE